MINPAKTYTLDEYIEILHRRILFIVIPFLLIVIGGTIYAFTAHKQYIASTIVLVSPQRIPEAFGYAAVTSRVEERLQSIAQEIMSRPSLEKIIIELGLYEKERKSLSKAAIVQLMRKNIKVELPTKRDEKGIFTISFIGDDPNTVTTVANRLASLFIAENIKIKEQQTEGTTEFLANELAKARARLYKVNRRTTVGKGELKKELEALQAKYTDNHPDVITMKKKIAALEKNKDEERIEQTPAREQDMGSMGGEYQSLKANYETLLKRSQEAQQAEDLEKRQKGEQFRVIEPAIIPEKPFAPDKKKILLISLFAGLASGLALAFMREQLDRSFHDADDVEISLGIKVLATIPKIEEKAS